jgi:capsular polysaccharide biosynthesis protein
MSQQGLDLNRSVQIVRRHRILVGVMVVIGILIGCVYAVLFPAKLTGTALVVLPQTSPAAAAAAAGTATGTGADGYTATQQVIAGSNVVLAGALPNVRPAMSLSQLRDNVQIGSPDPSTSIISVNAQGKTAADAEATANAVADSYIKYVNSASTNSAIRASASMLEPATSATGRGQAELLIISGVLGGLAGGVIGVITALAIGRKDKRLRRRDEIANSIGIPVLTSLPAARPSSAVGWSRLLEDYQPIAVHAWRLRVVLQQLRRAGEPGGPAAGSGGTSVLVLSLSSDPGALALGPQLAAFAVSLGISTLLVVGPQQDANVTAALRTACTASPPNGPGHLQLAVHEEGDYADLPRAALTIVVATVDGRNPRMPQTMRTTTAVLAVSPGVASADELARVAVSAAIEDRDITGILVANPEPDDNTTGQIPQLVRPAQHRRPSRVSRLTTEIRR